VVVVHTRSKARILLSHSTTPQRTLPVSPLAALQVFFDVSIGGVPAGRIVMGL
jgi:hypothetical protein